MFKVHGYLDDKRVINWRMEHLPRTGDTLRGEALDAAIDAAMRKGQL